MNDKNSLGHEISQLQRELTIKRHIFMIISNCENSDHHDWVLHLLKMYNHEIMYHTSKEYLKTLLNKLKEKFNFVGFKYTMDFYLSILNA